MTLRAKLLLALSVLLAVTLGSNYLLVRAGARRGLLEESEKRTVALTELLYYAGGFVEGLEDKTEKLIGDQMLVEATLAAHLVDVAENYAHFTPEQINARLKDVADHTVLDEFWITDRRGHAYLRNRNDIDFTFPAHPAAGDQAGAFTKLLSMDRGQVVQKHMPRAYDGEDFKYAAVSGIDHPRIVQVGYRATSLATLTKGMTINDFAEWMADVGSALGAELLDLDGNVVARYHVNQRGGPGGVPPKQVTALARESLTSLTTLARRYGDVLLVARPTPPDPGRRNAGVFVVAFDDSATRRAIGRMMLYLDLAAAAIFAVGMLLAVHVSGGIAEPMRRLAEEAAEIGKGDLGRRVHLRGGREVTAMANALNGMSASLKEHIEELQRTTAAKERLEHELEIAADVQRAMLPPVLPRSRGLEISAFTAPARVVGGDFYDVLELPDGRQGFCIGDVSGKGLPAALLASQSLSVTRALALEAGELGPVLQRSNRVIYNTLETRGLFVTIVCGAYDPSRHTLTLANAGHLPPLLWRAGQRPRRLPEATSLPLGLMPELAPSEEELTLEAGDVLVFYTDGVTEAMNDREEMFGLERLSACLTASPERGPEAVARRVRQAVQDFVLSDDAQDDVTVLALQVTG